MLVGGLGYRFIFLTVHVLSPKESDFNHIHAPLGIGMFHREFSLRGHLKDIVCLTTQNPVQIDRLALFTLPAQIY